MTKPTVGNNIEFYFDPISPYAWLASTRLAEIEQKTGAEIIVKPILFAGLLKAHENIGPAEIAAKRTYTFRDVMRRANALGLAMESVPNHPFNPLLALRVCTVFDKVTDRRKIALALLDAGWAEGRDMTSEGTVREIIESCGYDADLAFMGASDPVIKQALINNTNAAIDLGIFGVPTFRIDNEIFWGEDRISELLSYMNGQRVDETKLKNILAREALHRKR